MAVPQPSIPLNMRTAVLTMLANNPTWPIYADYIASGVRDDTDTSQITDPEVASDCFIAGNAPYNFWGSPGLEILREKLSKVSGKAAVAKAARETLEVEPNCVDAYITLGSSVTTYARALEAFEKGEEVAKKLIGLEKLRRMKQGIFGNRDYRSLWASMACVANTLRKMGRWEESLAKFEELARYDHDDSGPGTYDYINVIPIATECFFALGRWDDCERFMKKNSNKFENQSSSNIRWFNQLLIDWNRSKKFALFSIEAATNFNAYIFDYLTGARAPPNTIGSRHVRWQGSISNAVMYYNVFAKYWNAFPSAIEALKPWTMRAKFMQHMFFPVTPRILANFQEYMKELKARGIRWKNLVFVGDAVEMRSQPPYCMHLAHQLVTKHHQELLKALLEIYQDDLDLEVVREHHETILHPAAYFGSLECVDLLLKYGACIDVWDDHERSPIHNAANQMNADILERLLKGAPPHFVNLRQTPKSPAPLGSMIDSSLIECLGKETKCQRCMAGSSHAPGVNVFKTLQVLLDHGANPDGCSILCETLRTNAAMEVFMFAARHPKVDPDEVTADGRSPLIDIAMRSQDRPRPPNLIKCLMTLLAYRHADIRLSRKYKGKTALEWFEKYGWKEAVQVMKRDPNDLRIELEGKAPKPAPASSGAAAGLQNPLWVEAMNSKGSAAVLFASMHYQGAVEHYTSGISKLKELQRTTTDKEMRSKIAQEVSRMSNNKAMCFTKLSLFDDALTAADVSIAADPQWPKSRYYKALALFELKRFTEALQVLEQMNSLPMDDSVRSAYDALLVKVKDVATVKIEEVD
eukprot:TRINITY_DN1283_c0_g1_i2.p1 TRINITY_DN1283_c0_g1~~TRINITY_DN1283_c0_g1_i2.p1  ORF type:complete len:809 (-),score=146.25 TRINITY_DN1283_c0_g1_i2:990-3416(-)